MPKKSTTKTPILKKPAKKPLTLRRPMDRVLISIPGDWRAAFEGAASAAGMTVSEWFGDLGKQALPAAVAAALSTRGTVGRPKVYTGRPAIVEPTKPATRKDRVK
jgi:hypothetical protein